MTSAAASGVFKSVGIKRETTYGTAAGASGAQLLRRVSSTFDLAKDTYQSDEIRTDRQDVDFRHGVRRAPGQLNCELHPGSYSEIMQSILKRDFGTVTAIASLSLTIAASAPNYTITRASGDFLTGGIKIGHVIRLTGAGLSAGNVGKNCLVIGVTSTVLTVRVLNGLTLTAEGPIASCTVTVTGKTTYVPASGHTDYSYTLEHWFSDISQSEVYTGVKFSKMDIALPPTGKATVNFAGQGQDITTATSQYFSSPTAATTTSMVAAVNGVLLVNGTVAANVTGLQITVDGAQAGDPVVGQNTIPIQFAGKVTVTGQITAQFISATLRDLFINETESSLVVALTNSTSASADFISIALPRIKFNGAQKTDAQMALIQTMPFKALRNTSGGSGVSSEDTTIAIQDSLAA